MKREELVAKGYTDEQVSELLDLFHANSSNITKENERLTAELDVAKNKIAGLTQIESEYNTFKQSQLTEQEKTALKEKEINENLAKSRIILNSAKAREIFSEIGGIDENVLKSIVTDNEETTVANANALLSQIKNIKEQTVNKTKEELSKIDITPTPSNNLETETKMTWENFDKLSSEEQNKFAMEHPDEFANL